MNIGGKISQLKESMGFKNYVEYGKAIGLPGDWLLELSKKDTVQTIDITRLIKIAEYHKITLDDLLKDNNEGNLVVDIKSNLPENDIGKLFNNIQDQLKENKVYFNGYLMNNDCKDIANDALDVLKGLIQSNL